MVLVLANLLLLLKTLALAGVFCFCHSSCHGSVSYPGHGYSLSFSPVSCSNPCSGSGHCLCHTQNACPGSCHGSGGREVTFLLKNH